MEALFKRKRERGTMSDFRKDWFNLLGAIPSVSKGSTATVTTKTGGKYSYDFTDLGSLKEVLVPILKKHNFVLYNRSKVLGTLNVLETVLMHVSGEQITSDKILPSSDDPQDVGAAETYFRRYNLCCLLNVVSEDDDDAVRAKPKVSASPRPYQAPQNQTSGASRPATSSRGPTEKMLNRMWAIAKRCNWNHGDVQLYVSEGYGVASPGVLTRVQYDQMCGDATKNIKGIMEKFETVTAALAAHDLGGQPPVQGDAPQFPFGDMPQ